jgi:hypothetical protein
MTIEQADVIDTIALNEAKGQAVLIISDHLPWDIDEDDHLLMLQTKINSYVDAIESGELFRKRPRTIGKHLAIQIAAKYSLSANGQKLVDAIKAHLLAFGLELRVQLYEQDAEGRAIRKLQRRE